MVMALDGLTRLCPAFLFDWRLYAERGQPSFHHRHVGKARVDECELAFLKKVSKRSDAVCVANTTRFPLDEPLVMCGNPVSCRPLWSATT